MITATFGKNTSLLCMLVFLFVLSYIIQISHVKLLSGIKAGAEIESGIVVPKPEVLKLMTLGYDQLFADWWWLSFIQYYGDDSARKKDRCKLAYNYLDLITKLDPNFTEPYWFAAFAVGRDAHRTDLAAKLIDRGIAANVDNWYLPFIAGINQYLFAHDELKAAKYYRQAAKYPHAPVWLARQAIILEAHGPRLLKEISIWQGIYGSAKENLVKKEAARRLIDLWISVYEKIPGRPYKQRAREELSRLGVKVKYTSGESSIR